MELTGRDIMTFKELEALTDDELREVALKKTKKGVATREALMAQRILWVRADMPFKGDEDTQTVIWTSMAEVK